MKNEEIAKIILENTKSNEVLLSRIEKIDHKIKVIEESKYQPFNLEQEITQNLRNNLQESIAASCKNSLQYSEHLRNITTTVISENRENIKEIIKEAVDDTLNNPITQGEILVELKKKLARTLVNNALSSCESSLSEIRKDTELMSKMKLIIVDIVDNYELTKI